MRLYIAIATTGRRDVLTQTLVEISHQGRRPDRVLICPAVPEDLDLDAASALPLDIIVVKGSQGSCNQRNAMLDWLSQETDAVVIFFDDDFFPLPDYLEQAEALFAQHPDVVAASGLVLADGAPGPGLSVDEARAIVRTGKRSVPEPAVADLRNVYGCNMCVRLATVHQHGLRFDTDLPLYAWLEDVDFSGQLSRFGRIVSNRHMQGVHLGAKKGRTSGVRLGYSQIANPWYLFRKRTLDRNHALWQVSRNLASNIRRFPKPEPWVDRRGRLLGNMIGLIDLITGRADPKRILKL